MVNNYWDDAQHSNYPSKGRSIKALYGCLSCKTNKRSFFLQVADDNSSIAKIGQYPAWSTSTNKDIEKLLGQHQEYMRRGQICESQGYGIGAFAYYRRIVEEIIDLLLEKIPALLSSDERAACK